MLKHKMFFTTFGCEIIAELKEGLEDAIVCSSHKINIWSANNRLGFTTEKEWHR